MRQALESHNDAIGFGFWIPAFAGMTDALNAGLIRMRWPWS